MPEPIAAKTQALMADALKLADVKQKFAEQAAEPRGWTPEATGRFIAAETDKWRKIVKSANVVIQ